MTPPNLRTFFKALILKIREQDSQSWLIGLLVVIILAIMWWLLSQLDPDPVILRRWIERLGPLAPVTFFLLNVVQIVVAPIPGYPVQVLGGVLFGFIPGSIYTVGGMVTGGTLAGWLGRRLGRPWLEKRMATETLEQWRMVARIDSFWTWWFILLIPLGDIPYFLAGLSQIRLRWFAMAILTSRGPFTILIVWAGDRVTGLPLTWLTLLMALVGLIVIIGFSQGARIERWGRSFITNHMADKTDVSDASDKSA